MVIGMNLLHLEILVVLDWVYRAWSELSKDLIVNSFLACGLSNPLDGSADNSITCFKSDGPIGERGLVVLREMRATSKGGDGRNEQSNDEEEGIGCDLNLDAIGEELDLFFDID
uniref:Candidate secreted effector n=1 Tax=Meloidogyne incognita TaxID=6306 RepID=A0A914MM04_MELIC